MKLERLSGVGKRKEERLKAAGYDMVEDVARANLNKLDSIKGLDGAELMKEAQKRSPGFGNGQEGNVRRKYVCGDCGKRFPNKSGLRVHQSQGIDGDCLYEQWGRTNDQRVKKAKYRKNSAELPDAKRNDE